MRNKDSLEKAICLFQCDKVISHQVYCAKRRDSLAISPNAILKVKNFVRSVGAAQHGWAKTFKAIDPLYGELTVDEIINRIFATSNRDDLVTYLETMKYMYQNSLSDQKALQKFHSICSAFGIDHEELN